MMASHPSRAVWAVGILAGLLVPVGFAHARESGRATPKLRAMPIAGEGSDLRSGRGPGAFSTAQAGTTWFGGTMWAADSMRWEAIEGQLWTFESGVGSSIVPPGGADDLSSPTREWVNPIKAPGLHATMEGWIGIDETYSSIPYFRRLGASDPRWQTPCVGLAAGLGGSFSFWAGVLKEEADGQCFSRGQGYGNNWDVCIGQSFTYTGGGVTLGFNYRNETEVDYDFTTVVVDTTGSGDEVEVASYTGVASGAESLSLVPGVSLPVTTPTSITIKFCVTTDGGWSDQDGLYPTECGAFAVDDITVVGGGISHGADFEAEGTPDADEEHDGWVLSPARPGPGGDWSSLHHVNDLPPMEVLCPCALYDSVLAFPDDLNGHGPFTENMAASPWIDLEAAGKVGAPGKVLRYNTYANLPLRNYIFPAFTVQYYPALCPTTGKLTMSPWIRTGQFYYGIVSQCTSPLSPTGSQIDFSGYIPSSAEQVRIALGVLSYCRFFANCTQVSNTSPWYDQVGFGVYGAPEAPYIFVDVIDKPQDNFPENGTLNLNAPGRVDCNNIQGDSQPEIATTLGDTLIISGGVGNAEVYVHFRVAPGPGTNVANFNAWWNKHPDSNYLPDGTWFKMARCDTAERGNSGPISGNWMTAYHEGDPNFTGADRDIDPSDVAPNGGLWRLANDIFPDDLFAPGTRIDMFYTSNEVGSAVQYKTPVGLGAFDEMEILPSSMTAGGIFNCVLYVDHFDRGAQGTIEEALTATLGTGSENFEGTNWDRYDVNAASSQQASFGRPLQTEYGASVIQALGYAAILWNSGNLYAFNLTKEDADILLPWLLLPDYDFKNLYLSGDGLVYSAIYEGASEPSARSLLEEIAGVTIRTGCTAAGGAFSRANCPAPGSPEDLTPCVSVDPVTEAVVAGSGAGRTVDHLGQGNGCPEMRSFDVLYAFTPDFGIARGDELYRTDMKYARFASISTDASPGGILNFKIVTDGLSVHERRDAGTPCDYEDGGRQAVRERLTEVLGWFGYDEATSGCSDRLPGTGVTAPEPVGRPVQLLSPTPNPLLTGTPGRLRFTLPWEGRAEVGVYDLQGRLVRRVFDAVAPAGDHETTWDGRDEAGTPVGSGVYFVRLRAGGEERSTRVVVLGIR